MSNKCGLVVLSTFLGLDHFGGKGTKRVATAFGPLLGFQSFRSRVVGSRGFPHFVILLGLPLYMNKLVVGVRPFPLYHRFVDSIPHSPVQI